MHSKRVKRTLVTSPGRTLITVITSATARQIAKLVLRLYRRMVSQSCEERQGFVSVDRFGSLLPCTSMCWFNHGAIVALAAVAPI